MFTESWGAYHPEQRDAKGSKTIQNIFNQFINTNGHNMNSMYNITDFGDSGRFSNYSVLVIDFPEPRMEVNTKLNICSYFAEISITAPNFWWMN